MSNILQIFFEREPIYWSGDDLSGYCELTCENPIQITKVKIEIIGFEHVTMYRSHNNDGPPKHIKNEFLKIVKILNGKGSEELIEKETKKDVLIKTIKKLTEKKMSIKEGWRTMKDKLLEGQKSTELESGKYVYMFNIRLPTQLPPTCEIMGEKDRGRGRIKYNVKVTVHTPIGKRKICQSMEINVLGSLYDVGFVRNVSKECTLSENKTFVLSKGLLQSTVKIPSQVYHWGDRIGGSLLYTNTTKKRVMKTIIRLVQNSFFVTRDKAKRKFRKVISVLEIGGAKKGETIQRYFNLLVPSGVVEPIRQTKFLEEEGILLKLIKVNYKLEIIGKVNYALDLKQKFSVYILRRENPWLNKNARVLEGESVNIATYENPEIINQIPESNQVYDKVGFIKENLEVPNVNNDEWVIVPTRNPVINNNNINVLYPEPIKKENNIKKPLPPVPIKDEVNVSKEIKRKPLPNPHSTTNNGTEILILEPISYKMEEEEIDEDEDEVQVSEPVSYNYNTAGIEESIINVNNIIPETIKINVDNFNFEENMNQISISTENLSVINNDEEVDNDESSVGLAYPE